MYYIMFRHHRLKRKQIQPQTRCDQGEHLRVYLSNAAMPSSNLFVFGSRPEVSRVCCLVGLQI